MVEIASDPAVTNRRRVFGGLIMAGLFAWASLALFPGPPRPLGIGVDESWRWGLTIARLQGLAFGRDIVFTYGPLSYLAVPDPGGAPPGGILAYRMGTYALMIFGLARLLRARSHSTALVALLVLCLMILLPRGGLLRLEVAYLTLCLAWVVDQRRWRTVELIGAGLIAGLAILFKIDTGIWSWSLFYVLLFEEILQSRDQSIFGKARWLGLALLPPSLMCAAFALLPGGIRMLWPYLRSGWELVIGYGEAMALSGPRWQLGLALLSLVALFVALPFLCEDRQALRRAWAPALLTAVFAYKHGMVRQDGHADNVQMALAVAALFPLLCARATIDRRLFGLFAVFSAAMGVFVMLTTSPAICEQGLKQAMLGNLKHDIQGLLDWRGTLAGIAQQSRASLAPLRLDARYHHAVGTGTVDSFPHDIDLIVANGWRFRPRPVFQSYATYTPFLDGLNAAHMASPAAADFVLLQIPLDGRHPSMQDTRSWREMFNRYDLRLADPPVFLLSRRAVPRFAEPESLGSTFAFWDQAVAVPQVGRQEFVLMKVEIDKSIWGIARGALLRVSPVYLEATYGSGRVAEGSVTRANLEGGAFIDPLPQGVSDLLPYFGQFGNGGVDRVLSIRWRTPGPNQFTRRIRISWYRVRLRPDQGRQSGSASGLSYLRDLR